MLQLVESIGKRFTVRARFSGYVLLTALLVCLVSLSACNDPQSAREACDKYWMDAREALDPAEAEMAFEHAVEEGRRSSDQLQLPRVLIDYGNFLLDHYHFEKAVAKLNLALSQLEEIKKNHELDSGQQGDLVKLNVKIRVSLAKALTKSNRLEEAEKEYRDTLNLHDKTLLDLSSKIAVTKDYIVLLRKLGKNEMADKLEIESESAITSVDDCDLMFLKAEHHVKNGELDKARRVMASANAASEKFGLKSNRRRDSFYYAAKVEMVQGNIPKAKDLLLKALDRKEFPATRSSRDVARDKVALSICEDLENHKAEAESLFKETMQENRPAVFPTLDSLEESFQNNGILKAVAVVRTRRIAAAKLDPSLMSRNNYLDALVRLADLLKQLHQYDEAEKYYREELKYRQTNCVENLDGYLYSLYRLSDNFQMSGRLAEDRDFLRKIVIPKNLTPKQLDNSKAFILNLQSQNCLAAKNWLEAEKKARQALPLAIASEDKLVIGKSYQCISESYKRRANYTEALTWLEKSIKLWTEPKFRDDLADDKFRMGELYALLLRPKDSRDIYLQQWETMSRHGHRDPGRKYSVALRIASQCILIGLYDEALEWVDKSEPAFRSFAHPDPYYKDVCMYTRADALMGLKKFDQAFDLFKKDLDYTESLIGSIDYSAFTNSIHRFFNLADFAYRDGKKDFAFSVVEFAFQPYLRHPEIKLPELRQRFNHWITCAKNEGRVKQSAEWAERLRSHP